MPLLAAGPAAPSLTEPPTPFAPSPPSKVLDGIELRIVRTGDAEADLRWLGRVRRVVRAKLRLWRHEDHAADAALLVTELLTNAFQHTEGSDVGLRVTLTPAHLRIEVADGSPRRPHVRQAGPDDEGGRGLLLVQALATAWGTSDDGTTTWCTLRTSGTLS
ncbi:MULTISPECIES: ATP-binding protein [Streptomyces]|uniref:ATP-binding protein n=1 Tax=Streptomyces TaxID=1883 RepID=UPI0022497340|nr:ATP-binding protein [Streptomyces sp. JHD 1]MCX2968227.1 ATP-binding protein [Streptomyces sp. JHD 1]